MSTDFASKYDEGGAAAAAAAGNEDSADAGGKMADHQRGVAAVIDVKEIEIDPVIAPLNAPLDLTLRYTSDRNLGDGAYWDMSYTVDVSGKRIILPLGRTAADVQAAPAGNTACIHVESFNVKGKRKHILNVGLLCLSLKTGDEDSVIDVRLVVQVMDREGELTRHIMNPLE